jgi:hypothetical protein
MACQET